jgi:GntR family transcriptional repressor for pyruvate dehydrogenase complex
MGVLTSEIVRGERPPGEALPPEQELAAQFGVSRGVARETIRGLEERGLVSVRHGRGATVNGPERWERFDPDVLEALLASPRSPEVLGEYIECRRILEIEAAGLAARRATPEDVRRLAEAYARMEATAEQAAGDPGREDLFHEADLAFHETLIAGTRNQALAGLAGRLHRCLLAARYPLARPQHRIQRALPEHRRILDAVRAGDSAQARAAMSAHLSTVEGYLREHAGSVGGSS